MTALTVEEIEAQADAFQFTFPAMVPGQYTWENAIVSDPFGPAPEVVAYDDSFPSFLLPVNYGLGITDASMLDYIMHGDSAPEAPEVNGGPQPSDMGWDIR